MQVHLEKAQEPERCVERCGVGDALEAAEAAEPDDVLEHDHARLEQQPERLGRHVQAERHREL